MTTSLPYPLGRVVEHDQQSRRFPAMVAATKPKSVIWSHYAPVLNQGTLGSCTGHAMAQWLNTDMVRRARMLRSGNALDKTVLTDADAVQIYSRSTRLDRFPGTYPPTDTGSSGLAACKAAKAIGLITEYRHAFGFQAMLMALQHSPVLCGTTWTQDMFTPGADGVIRNTGPSLGGHEYLILGANHERGLITILNSWGPDWGRKGRAFIPFSSMMLLLADQGDVTVPVL